MARSTLTKAEKSVTRLDSRRPERGEHTGRDVAARSRGRNESAP
jgi:hypothetical protein